MLSSEVSDLGEGGGVTSWLVLGPGTAFGGVVLGVDVVGFGLREALMATCSGDSGL